MLCHPELQSFQLSFRLKLNGLCQTWFEILLGSSPRSHENWFYYHSVLCPLHDMPFAAFITICVQKLCRVSYTIVAPKPLCLSRSFSFYHLASNGKLSSVLYLSFITEFGAQLLLKFLEFFKTLNTLKLELHSGYTTVCGLNWKNWIEMASRSDSESQTSNLW